MPATVQLVLLHGNTPYVILVYVTRTLMCSDGWSSVSVRHEMYHLRHMSMQSHMDRTDTAHEDGTVAAVEREPWRSSRELELFQTTFQEVLHDDQWHAHHHSRSVQLFPDGCPLWMQFCERCDINTTFCGQTKCVLLVTVCSKSSAPSGTEQSSWYPRTWLSSSPQLQCLGRYRRGHCRGPLSATWQAHCSTI